MEEHNRLINLEGTYNTRDVSGYRTNDGRQTQPYRLLRSDGLHALTPADIVTLRQLGLKTVVDLRRDDERAHEPNVLAQEPWIDYRPVPIYQAEPHARGFRTDTLFPFYCALIVASQPTIRDTLALLAEGQNYPVMVHCSAGKDRTGLIVALALHLAGVPRQTILADYAPSGANIEPLKPKFRAAFARNTDIPPEIYEQLLLSPPEAIAEMFDFVDEEYGGVAAYARHIGLSNEQIGAIRENLLNP